MNPAERGLIDQMLRCISMLIKAFAYSISQDVLLPGSRGEPVVEDHVSMFIVNCK